MVVGRCWLRTSSLDAERQNVAHDKDLGEPLWPDDGMRRRVEAGDEAPEDHVDGRREEGRPQKKEQGLDDEGVLRIVGVFVP